MIKIVGVRFRSAGKVYYFDPKDLAVRMGDHVIAETSKGPEYGTVSTCMKMVDEELVQQPLRALVRTTTDEDEQKISALRVKEKEALRVCREKVREHGLDMKMVDAEYAFDESKVLFYFTADGRVDFRNLVKDLAGIFHVRIELRQIGVRDETRMLGGIGTCGRELCCATFLRDFQPVSIKMAKEQNLSLNPAKISGACGRLMCCLKNEEATYEYLNARMPKMGEEAITADGQSGKVVELDVLRQRVRVLFEEGDTKEIETFPVDELTFRPRKKKQEKARGANEPLPAQDASPASSESDDGENAPAALRQGRSDRRDRQERLKKADKADKPGKEKDSRSTKRPKDTKGTRENEGAPELKESKGKDEKSEVKKRRRYRARRPDEQGQAGHRKPEGQEMAGHRRPEEQSQSGRKRPEKPGPSGRKKKNPKGSEGQGQAGRMNTDE